MVAATPTLVLLSDSCSRQTVPVCYGNSRQARILRDICEEDVTLAVVTPTVVLLNNDNGDASAEVVLTAMDCVLASGSVSTVGRWLVRCEHTPVGQRVALAVLSGPHGLAVCLAYPELLDLLTLLSPDQRHRLGDEIVNAVIRGRAVNNSCVARLVTHCARGVAGLESLTSAVLAPWFTSVAVRTATDRAATVSDLWTLDPTGCWAVALLRHDTVDLEVLSQLAARVGPYSPVVDELPWQMPDGPETAQVLYAGAVMKITAARLQGHSNAAFVSLANNWTGTLGELLRSAEVVSGVSQPHSEMNQTEPG